MQPKGRAKDDFKEFDIVNLLCRLSEFRLSKKLISEAFVPNVAEKFRTEPMTYLVDSALTGEHFVFTLWNATNVGHDMLGINGNKPPSVHDVVSKKLDKGYIPGYPLYYYINASKGRKCIYTVKPVGAFFSSIKHFENLMRNFIVCEKADKTLFSGTEFGDTGITFEGIGGFPSFETKIASIGQNREKLLERVSKIKSIICSINLKDSPSVARKSLLDVLVTQFAQKISPTDFDRSKELRYELKIEFTEESLKDYLDNFYQTENENIRVGFKLDGDKNVKWMDKVLVKYDKELSVTSKNSFFNAKELLGAILESGVL